MRVGLHLLPTAADNAPPLTAAEQRAEERLAEINRLSYDLGFARGRLEIFRDLARRAKRGTDIERMLAASLLIEEVLRWSALSLTAEDVMALVTVVKVRKCQCCGSTTTLRHFVLVDLRFFVACDACVQLNPDVAKTLKGSTEVPAAEVQP